MPYEDGSGDGLPLLRRVRRDHPALPIIVLTMLHNPALTRGMLAAGINGLVAKGAMTKELQLAVGAVMNGRTYICEAMREHVIDWSPPAERTASPTRPCCPSARSRWCGSTRKACPSPISPSSCIAA